MTRLIVLPLPAVSRPSKMTTILAPSVRTHSCIFTSSPCRRNSSVSYSFRASRFVAVGLPRVLSLPPSRLFLLRSALIAPEPPR